MIAKYFNDTITRVRYSKNNRGQIVLESTAQYQGRIERDFKITLSSEGEDQYTNGRLFLDLNADVVVGDRIFYGAIETGEIEESKLYPVRFVIPQKGFTMSHLEVHLG